MAQIAGERVGNVFFQRLPGKIIRGPDTSSKTSCMFAMIYPNDRALWQRKHKGFSSCWELFLAICQFRGPETDLRAFPCIVNAPAHSRIQ